MELDRMFEKTKSPEEINELIKQSEQLTVAKKDIEKLKRELQESAKKNRSLMEELNVTVRLCFAGHFTVVYFNLTTFIYCCCCPFFKIALGEAIL